MFFMEKAHKIDIQTHTDWGSKKYARKAAYMHSLLVEAGTKAIPSKEQNLL